MLPVNGKEKQELNPKRAILPQFDFVGLPCIPSAEPYKTRKHIIANNSEAVHNKACRTKLTSLPAIRSNNNKARHYSDNDNYVLKQLVHSSPPSSVMDSKMNVLDRATMLQCGHSESPELVLEVIADERNLSLVDTSCLREFTHLYYMNLTGNFVEMEQLAGLPVLKELILNCNNLRGVRISSDGFSCLEKLDLSYNIFDDPYLFDQLANLKRLRILNLSSNNFGHLPRHLGGLTTLEELILESNVLQEDVFESLNTIPSLKRVNLNRNFIERIPILALEGLSDLQELLLGNNKLMYYDDIYAIKEYKSLKKLVLWGNPIVNRRKEIENVYVEIGRPGLIIIVDGPIPLQSKYLGVTKFYTEKFRSVEYYNPFKRQPIASNIKNSSWNSKEIVPDLDETIEDEQQDEEVDNGSFFLTETKITNFEEAVPSPISPVNIGNSRASRLRRNPFDRPLMNNNMYTSAVNSSVKKSMNDLTTSVNLASGAESLTSEESDDPYGEIPMNGTTVFDYNSDWFNLDAALETLGESLRNDPIVSEVPSTLYHNDFKSKKKMFSALKFALQNPLSLTQTAKVIPPSSDQ